MIGTARDLAELKTAIATLRRSKPRLALVPTMGALHTGHLKLVETARRHADAVIVSIFVNPLQFNASDDLARYPRDEAGDLAALDSAGADLAWLPGVEVMYPPGSATVIEVAGPSEGWEGTARPGHFRGVATVCTKLFLQTGADLAVFGEKDWQQLQVVRRAVRDLNIPIGILGEPTVREADGLAMSSRNRFLSPEERALAPRLPALMRELATALADGEPAAPRLSEAGTALRGLGFEPDYLALVEAESLRPIPAVTPGQEARLIAAARLGTVRLLDNFPVG